MVNNSIIRSLLVLLIVLVSTIQVYADIVTANDSINEPLEIVKAVDAEEVEDVEELTDMPQIPIYSDTIPTLTDLSMPLNSDSLALDSIDAFSGEKVRMFFPNPTRAVWMSALFPGLGQVYNRKYWKLPIIVGGAVGITYALMWNTQMLTDYALAYKDSMDNDPNTNSYMDFYAPNTNEADIDMGWLQGALKTKKDYYRHNRELSIICLVGLYMLCMVDAYVDASLSQFDISPDLSMNVYPAILQTDSNGVPSAGIQWSINF